MKETWNSKEQKESNFQGEDYFPFLTKLKNVELFYCDFLKMGLRDDISEVFKSDILRLHLLGTFGGFWADTDIFFISPMENLSINIEENKEKDTVICCHCNFHSIGFLGSSPNNKIFKDLFEKSKVSFYETEYQSVGSFLYSKEIKKVLPNIVNLSFDSVYPIRWNELDLLWGDNDFQFSEETIGIHWFAGNPETAKFENIIDRSNINQFKNSRFIREILK